MNKNVNVFIGVVLCAVLCGCFVWLNVSTEEVAWGPSEIYYELQSASSTGASYTNATFVAPSSGDVALPLSSSSLRRSSTSLYAGAYASSSLPSLQGGVEGRLTSSQGSAGGTLSSGGGLYATSSAEFKSFGGGGNGGAAMGGAIANRQSNSGLSNPSLQGGAGVGISPIAYSTARRGGMSSVAGDDLAMMAAENPVMAMTNAASTGVGNAVYAGMGYTTMGYYGTASYGAGRGMQGRRNANSIGGNVLNDWILSLIGHPESGYMYEDGGIYYFDENTLRELYNAAIANGELPTGVTWEQFLSWFEGKSDIYQFPIPDGAWFLCLLALGYTLYIIYRRKKQIQVQ